MVKFHYKLKTKKTLENRKLVGQLKHKSTKGGKGIVLPEKGISKLGLDMNELDENPLRRIE
ncbi:MAG: hypothetical protein HY607_04960 [Planctomycetes bacterium]|uniref:hypothetical protein n=1 Tax=Candidatus Wunengus californicus TaxID=3367619 RepID=UPI004025C7C4|nr:hypothetical protein [Planctomycetota bacterium]